MQIEHWAARSRSSALSADCPRQPVCPTVAVHARCKNWAVCSAPLTRGWECERAQRGTELPSLHSVLTGHTGANGCRGTFFFSTQRCETQLSSGKKRTPQPGVGSAFTFTMTYKPFSVWLCGHWSPSQNPHSVRSYFSYVERRNWVLKMTAWNKGLRGFPEVSLSAISAIDLSWSWEPWQAIRPWWSWHVVQIKLSGIFRDEAVASWLFYS